MESLGIIECHLLFCKYAALQLDPSFAETISSTSTKYSGTSTKYSIPQVTLMQEGDIILNLRYCHDMLGQDKLAMLMTVGSVLCGTYWVPKYKLF